LSSKLIVVNIACDRVIFLDQDLAGTEFDVLSIVIFVLLKDYFPIIKEWNTFLFRFL
jgi:hypothetical protein